MRKFVVFSLFLLPFCLSANSLFQDGEYLGRGNSGVALEGERVSAVYYNPAALKNLSEPQIEFGIRQLPEGKRNQYCFAFGYPFSNYRISLSGNQIIESQKIPDNTSISVTVAKETKNAFLKNFGLRLDYQQKDKNSGVDCSWGTQFPGLGLNWGLAIENIFYSNINGYSGIIFGGVKSFDRWRFFLDTEISRNRIWIKPALEYQYYQGLGVVRLGYFNDEESPNVTFGLSGNIWPVKIDFSVLYRGAFDTYLFSVGAAWRFGPGFDWYYLTKTNEKLVSLDREISNLTGKKKALQEDIQRLQQVYQENKWLLKSTTTTTSPEVSTVNQKEEKKILQKISKETKTKPVTPASSGPKKHLVQPGDTLRSLAQKYYGNPNKWQKIYEANSDKIERGAPRVGVELVIP